MLFEAIGIASGLSVFAERLAQAGGNPFLILAPSPKAPLAPKKDPMAELFLALQRNEKKASELPFFADQNWPAEQENEQALQFMRQRLQGVEARAQAMSRAAELEGLTNQEEFLVRHVGFAAYVEWEPEESEFLLKGDLQLSTGATAARLQTSLHELAQRHPGVGFIVGGYVGNEQVRLMVTAQGPQPLEELAHGREQLIAELGL